MNTYCKPTRFDRSGNHLKLICHINVVSKCSKFVFYGISSNRMAFCILCKIFCIFIYRESDYHMLNHHILLIFRSKTSPTNHLLSLLVMRIILIAFWQFDVLIWKQRLFILVLIKEYYHRLHRKINLANFAIINRVNQKLLSFKHFKFAFLNFEFLSIWWFYC